jgi:hypothetical protein
MYQLCEFSSNKKWKLQYRATRDGFSAENFHSKCDGFENTLTLIKSEHGNIFGGFAEKKWLPTREFIIDPKAYIFSLVNKGNRPFKVLCSKNATAICCSPILDLRSERALTFSLRPIQTGIRKATLSSAIPINMLTFQWEQQMLILF